MKSSEEMTKSLLDRRQTYIAKKRQTKKRLITVGTTVCTAFLVVLLGWGLRQKQPIYEISTSPVLRNDPDIQEQTTGDTQTEIQTLDRISVNQLDTVPITEDMYIALMRDDFVQLTEQEMAEYFGISFNPDIPEDLQPAFGSMPRAGIYRRNGGTGEVYHDTQSYSFVNPENHLRGVAIQYAKGVIPYTFYLILADSYEASLIGGEEIYIGQYEDMYIAEFFYKDVGFRVFAQGVTQQELVALLSSIIV